MSTEENKALVRRFQEGMMEAIRTGNPAPLLDTCHPTCAFDMPGMPPTLEGMKQALPAFHAAFPDLRTTLGEMTAEGDKVAYRLTVTGTHTGEFMGIAPTGKRVTVTETHIDQIANGKLVRHDGDWINWACCNSLGSFPRWAKSVANTSLRQRRRRIPPGLSVSRHPPLRGEGRGVSGAALVSQFIK